MKKDIYLVSNEDADSFICVGTKNKNEALTFLRKALKDEYNFEDEYLPEKDDLELKSVYETEELLWWGNVPGDATFKERMWSFSL